MENKEISGEVKAKKKVPLKVMVEEIRKQQYIAAKRIDVIDVVCRCIFGCIPNLSQFEFVAMELYKKYGYPETFEELDIFLKNIGMVEYIRSLLTTPKA